MTSRSANVQTTVVPNLPTAYYDKPNRIYHLRASGGDYLPLGRNDLTKHLVAAGLRGVPIKGEELSPVDWEIIRIQDNNNVDFVGALAGHLKGFVKYGSSRCLVVDEPTFVEPRIGDCPLILGILEGMFGTQQMNHVLGWIKIALDMFQKQTWLAGQALVLCGPAGAGKNLFATLIAHLFGGRMPGKPYQYMTGRTTFNAELLGAELLTVEDEAEGKTIKDRRQFGAAIKNVTVNPVQRFHDKGKRALSVTAFQRLIISLNDEPEALLVLPLIEPSIEDKVMLLKVAKRDMPMPTSTADEQRAFMEALIAELPAFAHFVINWTIPVPLRSPRFGVTHFHHPTLMGALKELSPEQRLMELIDEFIFSPSFPGKRWVGRSTVLERELKRHPDNRCAREAEKLLPGVNSCGVYLGRLAKIYSDRISYREVSTSIWTILAPADSDEATVESQTTALKSSLDTLREQIRADQAQKRMGSEEL